MVGLANQLFVQTRDVAVEVWRNWKIAAILAIFYSLNALFIGKAKLFAGHGEVRMFIFIPAITAVWFGPVVGGLVGGFGNLLIDIIDDVILSGESLEISNFIGFLANLIGAYITGVLRDPLEVTKGESIISPRQIVKYIRNTIAAIIGMGVVTGEIIGLGLYAAGYFPSPEIGFILAWEITKINSMFLLIAMVPVQIFVTAFEKHRIKTYHEQADLTRKPIMVEGPKDSLIEIRRFRVAGDGLIQEKWGLIEMVLKNNSNASLQYRIELNSDDKIDPSVSYTRVLKSGEEDEKYFKIYPFDDGVREMDIFIKPWMDSISLLEENFGKNLTYHYKYRYRVMAPLSDKFQGVISFVTMLAFIGVTISALQSVLGTISGIKATYFGLAIAIVIVEFIILIAYYMRLKRRLKG